MPQWVRTLIYTGPQHWLNLCAEKSFVHLGVELGPGKYIESRWEDADAQALAEAAAEKGSLGSPLWVIEKVSLEGMWEPDAISPPSTDHAALLRVMSDWQKQHPEETYRLMPYARMRP